MPRAALLLGLAGVCGWLLWMDRQPEAADPAIRRVAISGSGWIAAGTARGSIAVFDPARGGGPRQFQARPGPLNDLRFSFDERWLAVANRNLTLWPVERAGAAPLVLRADGKNYGTVAFHPGGGRLLATTGPGGIEVIRFPSGRTAASACCSTVYGEAAFSPDGSAFATGGHVPRVWNSATGLCEASLVSGRSAPAYGPVVFDGGRIFIGSQEGTIRVWDAGSRRVIAASPRHPEWVDSIAVAESGVVAYASTRGVLRLWNPGTGEDRRMGTARPSSNVVFSRDGECVVFGTAAGRVEFRDAKSGELRRTYALFR